MGAALSAKVTLYGNIKHPIKTDDVLVVAEDCFDISDKALMASKIKHLAKGDMVTVKDYYCTEDKTFCAVRAWYKNKLYYIASVNLTLISLF